MLIDAGVLTETRLQAALAEQKRWGGRLGRTLVEMGFVEESAMVNALSMQLGLPVVDLDSLVLPASITQLLRVDLAERYGIFPLAGDPKTRSLQVATSDPTNFDALKEVSLQANSRVHAAVATASQIERAIRRYYYGERTIEPTRTANPSTFGVFEPSFDLTVSEPSPPKPPPPSAKPMPPLPGASAPRADEVTSRLKALEEASSAQGSALKALIELLVDSGLVSRDEYLRKLKR